MTTITGNRSLHFDTLAEGMAEAERVVGLTIKSVGNFSPAQNIDHLARTLRIVVGDTPPPVFPRWLKWIVRWRLQPILTQPASPGIKLPAKTQSNFWTEQDISIEEAIDSLRFAYQRFNERQATGLPTHPLFGKLTKEQHEQLQCRHFELHLGMIVEV